MFIKYRPMPFYSTSTPEVYYFEFPQELVDKVWEIDSTFEFESIFGFQMDILDYKTLKSKPRKGREKSLESYCHFLLKKLYVITEFLPCDEDGIPIDYEEEELKNLNEEKRKWYKKFNSLKEIIRTILDYSGEELNYSNLSKFL